jgi:hypothetical protein
MNKGLSDDICYFYSTMNMKKYSAVTIFRFQLRQYRTAGFLLCVRLYFTGMATLPFLSK